MRQSKMTIGRKFALTGAFLIGMTILLGIATLLGLGSVQRALSSVTEDSLAGVSASSKVESGLLEIRGDIWRHIASTDASQMAQMEREIQRLKDEVNTSLTSLEKSAFTDEERVLAGKIRPAADRYYKAWDGIIDLSRASKNEEANKKYTAEAAPAFDEMKQAVKAETEYHRTHGVQNGAEAQGTGTGVQSLIWVILVLSIVAGVGLLFLMVRGTNRALMAAVSDLGSGAGQVASAATQIAASSQSLAQGSNEQAASLEETSSSSEEINSMARRNTDNTRSAAELVRHLQEKFVETNHALDGTVAAMQELNGSSEKISKIIKVIDEIAFQTNILALNAAVEAARAGEAGMGFAVVADEVRNLAQRSAQAAKDTASLIEESIAKSRDGKSKVDHVAAAIRAIAQDSGKIQLLVDEVNVASQEQSRGIEQVAKAVTQMEQLTQRAAASAQESASASTQLTAQAEAMKGIVQHLTTMVNGDTLSGRGVASALPARVRVAGNATAMAPSRAAVASFSRQDSRKEFPLHDGESSDF